jgi:hypothetical protein
VSPIAIEKIVQEGPISLYEKLKAELVEVKRGKRVKILTIIRERKNRHPFIFLSEEEIFIE